jgi:uncharacterized DUF497 family protein
MTFEWDPEKAQRNHEKHGISFADAVEVVSDEYAITIEDRSSQEERHITIGVDALGRILVVVYTWRGESIRIISARKATARERAPYGEKP